LTTAIPPTIADSVFRLENVCGDGRCFFRCVAVDGLNCLQTAARSEDGVLIDDDNSDVNKYAWHLTYHLRAWNAGNIFGVNVHPQYNEKRRNTIWQAKKLLSFWGAKPPDPLRRGFVPGTPHIGSRSALTIVYRFFIS
jgi:hypothetical protein